jgi:hypothetical protein
VYRAASFHDVAGESSYHTLLLGLFVLLHMYDSTVEITSNIEAGDGRPDVVIHFTLLKKWLIFEFKKARSNSEDLEALAHEAKKQIIDKRYYLRNTGTSVPIGIAFYGKKMSPMVVGDPIVQVFSPLTAERQVSPLAAERQVSPLAAEGQVSTPAAEGQVSPDSQGADVLSGS